MAHRAGVDMPANPVRVRPFGAQIVVLHPQPAANVVQPAGLAGFTLRIRYGCSRTAIFDMAAVAPDNTLDVSRAGNRLTPEALVSSGKSRLTTPSSREQNPEYAPLRGLIVVRRQGETCSAPHF